VIFLNYYSWIVKVFLVKKGERKKEECLPSWIDVSFKNTFSKRPFYLVYLVQLGSGRIFFV
jgi:hypothetical protein